MMIPENTLDGLKRYSQERIPPGSFLTSVLENDLLESFSWADKENREVLYEIVCYCYNELPYDCWGSPEKVRKWLNREE